MYRAIGTRLDALDGWGDSGIVHWHSRRGGRSENRLRELRQDFAGGRMPCSDHQANALWLSLSALAYSVSVLFRHTLPQELGSARASTVRCRPLAISGRFPIFLTAAGRPAKIGLEKG